MARWPSPRPSTLAFIREARRIPGYRLGNLIHGLVYARWPYLYIGIGTGEHPAARVKEALIALARAWSRIVGNRPASPDTAESTIEFADTYHGKVITLEAARQLVAVDRDIDLGDLERVIPYRLAREIVLRDPDHIVVLDCPCRLARPSHCSPLDVCLIVGEPFASFVAEHHPHRSRWISQLEAQEILRAEHERGHVHHAFFKDAMLERFYAICNCCACCCGAMEAQRNGVAMLAPSGYLCVVDEALCAGCGSCVEGCQFAALELQDGHAFVDFAACMGCGVCVDRCPQGALALVRDERKGFPLEIGHMVIPATALTTGGV